MASRTPIIYSRSISTNTISDLRSRVQTTYDKALASSALTFTQPEFHHITERDVNWKLLYCPQLLKKPADKDADAAPKKKIDPFLPPQEELYIAPVGTEHFLTLNKFPVIRDHLILATTAFELQTGLLTEADWAAVGAVLASWEGGVYGFFNCGEHSGASQPHRHLQFLPMNGEEEQGLWGSRLVESGEMGDADVRKCLGVPFEHFVVKMPEEVTARDLRARYLRLLALSEKAMGQTGFSYNLGFTRRFMAMAPRTRDRVWPVAKGTAVEGKEANVPGIDPNGTILAGMLMAKTRMEMEKVMQDGIYDLLGGIGVKRQTEDYKI